MFSNVKNTSKPGEGPASSSAQGAPGCAVQWIHLRWVQLVPHSRGGPLSEQPGVVTFLPQPPCVGPFLPPGGLPYHHYTSTAALKLTSLTMKGKRLDCTKNTGGGAKPFLASSLGAVAHPCDRSTGSGCAWVCLLRDKELLLRHHLPTLCGSGPPGPKQGAPSNGGRFQSAAGRKRWILNVSACMSQFQAFGLSFGPSLESLGNVLKILIPKGHTQRSWSNLFEVWPGCAIWCPFHPPV